MIVVGAFAVRPASCTPGPTGPPRVSDAAFAVSPPGPSIDPLNRIAAPATVVLPPSVTAPVNVWSPVVVTAPPLTAIVAAVAASDPARHRAAERE